MSGNFFLSENHKIEADYENNFIFKISMVSSRSMPAVNSENPEIFYVQTFTLLITARHLHNTYSCNTSTT